MVEQIQSRLTYANVMATLAVFIALGGGAVYAADKIGGSEIKKKAIKKRHVSPHSITGAKIRKGAVKSVHLGDPLPITPVVRTGSLTVPTNGQGGQVAACEAREVAVGGGFSSGGIAGTTQVDANRPLASSGETPRGWLVVLDNTSNRSSTYEIFAVCVESED